MTGLDFTPLELAVFGIGVGIILLLGVLWWMLDRADEVDDGPIEVDAVDLANYRRIP